MTRNPVEEDLQGPCGRRDWPLLDLVEHKSGSSKSPWGGKHTVALLRISKIMYPKCKIESTTDVGPWQRQNALRIVFEDILLS
jgi:hypothetical protein